MMQTPGQAAGTPAAKVQSFKQIQDLPTLIAMQQREPSIPLLAHIDEVRKRLEAQKSVQNQLAMQQAQQQGPQTLNDQILAGAEQAAGMRPTRMMATGGIVALQTGGAARSNPFALPATDALTSVGEFPIYSVSDRPEPGETRAQFEARKRREAAEADEVANRPLRRLFRSIEEGVGRLLDRQRATRERQRSEEAAARAAQGLRPAGSAAAVAPAAAATAPAAASTPAAAASTPAAASYPEPVAVREGRRAVPAATSEAAPRERRTPAEKPTGGRRQETPPAATAPAAAPDAITQALTALVAASTTPTEVPQALREQRTKVAGIQELMTKQAMDDAARVRDELDREVGRRETRAKQPFLESAERTGLLASYLSPKKGEFFRSLGRGIAAVESEEEKGRKELAQYRATEGERVRQLNNTYRQLQLENAKYEMAWSEGDMKTARESAEKITKLRYDAAVKTEELKNDRMRTQAEITRVNKPTDFELFMRNPERFRDYMGARTGPRDEAALTAANARLAAALNNDPILAMLRKQAENTMLTPAERNKITQDMEARIRQLRIENAPESAALGQAAGAAGAGARQAADAILEGTR